MRALLALLLLPLAGCAEPADPADPGKDTAARPIVEWHNVTHEGSFLGYAAPPAAAGTLREDGATVRDVFVANGTLSLVLALDAEPEERIEFYVADPSCTAPDVADCRGEEGFNDDFSVFTAPSPPMPGHWRFEVAGSFGSGPAPVAQVEWQMHVLCRLDRLVAGPGVGTCGMEP